MCHRESRKHKVDNHTTDHKNTESQPSQSRRQSRPQKPKEGSNYHPSPSRQRPNHSYHGQITIHTKSQRMTRRERSLHPSKHQPNAETNADLENS